MAGRFAKQHDVNDYSFANLTLILSLHHRVKLRSHSLAIYDNLFILGNACVGSSAANTEFHMAGDAP